VELGKAEGRAADLGGAVKERGDPDAKTSLVVRNTERDNEAA
jgi:hypothetical protein